MLRLFANTQDVLQILRPKRQLRHDEVWELWHVWRRFLRNPIRCFDGQLGIGTAFRFFRLASQPTETLVPFNVTWSGYSAVQIVVVEASAYNNVSSGLLHKKPEWPAESPICLLFGGSV